MTYFRIIFGLLAVLITTQSVFAATQMYFVHVDHLGTPQVMTDESQAVVWQRNALPFGEVVQETGALAQSLRFPGQYRDLETNYSYNYFRDYDPTTGRYVQSDPIGLNGGFNTYGYANQNPLKYTDPTGESAAVAVPLSGLAAALALSTPQGQKVLANFAEACGNAWSAWNETSANDPQPSIDPASGSDPDRGDLTKAGRAGQKHGDRAGSAFPPATGSSADKNRQGQGILDGIVNSPDRTDRPNRHGGVDVHQSPDGRGARFDQNGKFTGFLEPR
ncbi:RHS repeat-associated core domain-containing protein [Marinobacter sp. V034]|uniref:RHS repeat-associated core domain-containing protein n=1 Tax=Marinobacter sp. V034 TaxID=3459610 RepID=UPI004044C5EB